MKAAGGPSDTRCPHVTQINLAPPTSARSCRFRCRLIYNNKINRRVHFLNHAALHTYLYVSSSQRHPASKRATRFLRARSRACALRSLSLCSLQQCSTHPALELFLALLALQLAVRGQLFSRQSSLSTRLHSFHCDLTQHRGCMFGSQVLRSPGIAGGSLVQWRSMPRRERQLLVLVRVVDGGLDVHDDGVGACSNGVTARTT